MMPFNCSFRNNTTYRAELGGLSATFKIEACGRSIVGTTPKGSSVVARMTRRKSLTSLLWHRSTDSYLLKNKSTSLGPLCCHASKTLNVTKGGREKHTVLVKAVSHAETAVSD
jgi:hypothetical protein